MSSPTDEVSSARRVVTNPRARNTNYQDPPILAADRKGPHEIRPGVVGSELRGYVNANLMLQATDSSHAAGISGLMTNKSATRFGDYVAYQP